MTGGARQSRSLVAEADHLWFPANPAHSRIIHGHRFSQFPDILVPVAVEIDKGLNVHREGNSFGHDRASIIAKIIVAVDEDPSVLVLPNCRGEAFRGKIGEGQVDGSINMALRKGRS